MYALMKRSERGVPLVGWGLPRSRFARPGEGAKPSPTKLQRSLLGGELR
jgi:hypothetical protein